MIKYAVGWSTKKTIEPVECERETKHYVIINGRRNAKAGSYFDTYEDAWMYLHRLATIRLESAQNRLEGAQNKLADLNVIRQMAPKEEL